MVTKNKLNLEGMKYTQAIEWLEELFAKHDLNDNDSTVFKEILGVLRREYEDRDGKLQRWQEIPLTVAQKDNILKKYLSDKDKEDLINKLL